MASRNERRYVAYCKRKKAFRQRRRIASSEGVRSKQSERWLANCEEIKARNREHGRKWRAVNREKANEGLRRWRKNNPEKVNASTAIRRARKLQATPSWLTKEHKAEVLKFYKKAQETGLTVDHIVPLKGQAVCGLHVPWNLQLLTLSENSSKNNSLGG